MKLVWCLFLLFCKGQNFLYLGRLLFWFWFFCRAGLCPIFLGVLFLRGLLLVLLGIAQFFLGPQGTGVSFLFRRFSLEMLRMELLCGTLYFLKTSLRQILFRNAVLLLLERLLLFCLFLCLGSLYLVLSPSLFLFLRFLFLLIKGLSIILQSSGSLLLLFLLAQEHLPHN